MFRAAPTSDSSARIAATKKNPLSLPIHEPNGQSSPVTGPVQTGDRSLAVPTIQNQTYGHNSFPPATPNSQVVNEYTTVPTDSISIVLPEPPTATTSPSFSRARQSKEHTAHSHADCDAFSDAVVNH